MTSNPSSHPNPPKKRFNKETGGRLVSRWKESGLSQAAFCERESMSLSTLIYWRRKTSVAVSRSQSNAHFVELDSAPVSSPSRPPVEIVTPSGFQIRLSAGFSGEDLQRALQVVNASC